MSKTKVNHSSVFSSLLGDAKDAFDTSEQRDIPLDKLIFNPKQPRKYIDPATLATLTSSVMDKGVLEPILVRPVGESFELVAGERRTRAARAANHETIPAIIREMDDHQAFEVAIIENLQREDLNPVEETDAILHLISMRLERPTSEVVEGIRGLYDESRGRTGNTRISKTEKARIEKIFEALGRFSPSSFYTNRIPILSLPTDLLEIVRRGELNYPKAKQLARIKDDALRNKLLKQTLQKKLSNDDLSILIKQETSSEKPSTETHVLIRSVKGSLSAKRVEKLEVKTRKRVEKLLTELEQLLS